nr:molybdopterin-dependent oxidoreductase [Nocardioides sp.]
MGTNYVDGNTRLCTATAAAALKESFASDGQPGSYTDIDHADVICLYGHNMAETQTVLWARILDRLAGPNPPAIVCVDPRQTPVAAHATVHLAPRPGTNVMLMNALLRELLEHDGRVTTPGSPMTSCAAAAASSGPATTSTRTGPSGSTSTGSSGPAPTTARATDVTSSPERRSSRRSTRRSIRTARR